MDEGDYGRMLAKIAHSYATAKLGGGYFRPILINIIKGIRPFALTHLIWSQIETVEDSVDLHELSIEHKYPGSERFVIVWIRLFFPWKTPAHLVVAGEWRRMPQPLIGPQ
jgi:hypothetical protein